MSYGMMSTAARSAVSAIAIALLIVAGITLYVHNAGSNLTSQASSSTTSSPTSSFSSTYTTSSGTISVSSSSQTSGFPSVLSLATLSVRLTDPPVVPQGTRSLNLTYASLKILLKIENGSSAMIKNLIVNSSGTVNLLSIQNVSETVAVAKIPNGSLIYTIDFLIKSVSININGTVYPVQPALSGNTLTVVFYPPAIVKGDSVALIEISPVVVKTNTGYQMIPSAVAIVRHENIEHEEVGSRHKLNQTEENELNQSKPQLVANLESISVSGNTTSFTVLVNNTGSVPAIISAVSLHGNFDTLCAHKAEGHSNETEKECEHPDTVYFRVLNVTSSSGCGTASLKVVGEDENGSNGTKLEPGQCIRLVFSGVISMGESGNVILPSLAPGSELEVHVIASNGGELVVTCTLPLSSQSCVAGNGESD